MYAEVAYCKLQTAHLFASESHVCAGLQGVMYSLAILAKEPLKGRVSDSRCRKKIYFGKGQLLLSERGGRVGS